MSADNPIVEWYIVVKGDPIDLSDLLKFAGNQSICRFEKQAYGQIHLTSEKLKHLENGWAVKAAADEILRRVNGAMITKFPDDRPITSDHYFAIQQDGSINQYLLPETGVFELRGGRPTVLIDGVEVNGDGPEVGSWLEASKSDVSIANVLENLSKPADWVNLYNTFEIVTDSFGGRQKTRQLLCFILNPRESFLIGWIVSGILLKSIVTAYPAAIRLKSQ